MPSYHPMNISTDILGCRSSTSTSHSSATHRYASLYKVIPIRIIVDVSVAPGENDSVYSN